MSRYAVVITGNEGSYSAYAPDLPGCMVTGETIEVIQRNMKIAIAFRLGSMLKEGKPISEPNSMCGYVDVHMPPGSPVRELDGERFAVIIVSVDGGYSAYIPDLSGCMAQGPDLESVKKTIQQCVTEHLLTAKHEGRPVEGPQSRCGYVVVATPKGAIDMTSRDFRFRFTDPIPKPQLWWTPTESQLTTNASCGPALQVVLGNGAGEELTMTFCLVPRGSFEMGSPKDEIGRDTRETLHRVQLTRNFYLKALPVTQREWKAVMGLNPSHFKNAGPEAPVESVTWYDAVEFCNKLSDLEGLTQTYKIKDVERDNIGQIKSATVLANFKRLGYRLPTEAEWEHACRGETTTPIYTGELTIEHGGGCPELDQIGWYAENCAVDYEGASEWVNITQGVIKAGTHPVAQKQPSPFGLYDVLGNVWEWCWDRYEPYEGGMVTDPVGSLRGPKRVMRGGAWSTVAKYCRAAKRVKVKPSKRAPILGLRIVRPEPDIA